MGDNKFDSHQMHSKMELSVFLSKCRSQYTSTDSQQATKAVPKYTHNDRSQSKCYENKVLQHPIFSIGQYNFKLVKIDEQIPKNKQNSPKQIG